MTEKQRTLCIVVCAAGPASDVGKLIDLAQADDWEVFVVATPAAVPFLDVEKIESATGSPVRSEYRTPGEPRRGSAGKADAIIVAPATYNTINKLARGASDNYALGVLAEAIGISVPVLIVPFVNSALARRTPFADAVAELRTEGVVIFDAECGWPHHQPGEGGKLLDVFPWHQALQKVGAQNTG